MQFLSASNQCVHIESVSLMFLYLNQRVTLDSLHLMATTIFFFIEVLISIQSHRTDSCCFCFLWGCGGWGASILKFILKLNCTHRMLNSKTKTHQKSVYTWTLHTLTCTCAHTHTHKDKKSSTFYFMYTVQSTVSLYKSNSHMLLFSVHSHNTGKE